MGQLPLFSLKQLVRDYVNVVKKTQVKYEKSIAEGINCSSPVVENFTTFNVSLL